MLPRSDDQSLGVTIASERDAVRRDRERLPALEPRPPLWVDDLMGRAIRPAPGGSLHAISTGRLTLLTTTIVRASMLSAATLRERVHHGYRLIGRRLTAIQRTPLRFWNFVPDIGKAMDEGIDRYMVFNAGRHDAFAGGHGLAHPHAQPLATASAVGVDGQDLTIYCLASETPGTPIENPRQRSSWQYSARYGPVPPSFTRATVAALGSARRLLIGGTASIVGEDSRHDTDLHGQLEETLQNLAALVGAGTGHQETPAHAWRRLFDLRVYVRHDEHSEPIRHRIESACPNIRQLELVRAHICRPELLLEIEGLAEI